MLGIYISLVLIRSVLPPSTNALDGHRLENSFFGHGILTDTDSDNHFAEPDADDTKRSKRCNR